VTPESEPSPSSRIPDWMADVSVGGRNNG
jgi:hypothetical protein